MSDAPQISPARIAARRAAWMTAAHAVRDGGRALLLLSFALGAVVLITRRVMPEWAPHLGVIALAHAALLGLAILRGALRGRVDTTAAAADADRELNAGGLFLTLAERPDPLWTPFLDWKVRSARPPSLGIGAALGHAAPGLVFLVIALVLPQKEVARPGSLPVLGRRVVAELQRDLEALGNRGVLRNAEVTALRQDLDALRENVRAGRFGASEWEAADQIRSRLRGDVRSTVEDLAQIAREFQAAGDNPAAALAAVPKALGALKRSGLMDLLPKELDEAGLARLAFQAATGRLDPEQARRELAPLEDALRRRAGDIEAAFAGRTGPDAPTLDEAFGTLRDVLAGNGRGGDPDRRTTGVETTLHRRRVTSAKPVVAEKDDRPGQRLLPESGPVARAPARSFETVEREATRRSREQARHRGAVRRYFESLGETR
jgi:hypothetical protein